MENFKARLHLPGDDMERDVELSIDWEEKEVGVKLGQASGFTAGEYESCRLVVFDSTYTEGVVVSDDITLTVYDSCVS